MEKSFTINLIRCTILLVFCCTVANSCRGATILVSGITDEEKTIILQEHNRLRQLVANGRLPGQPGAENMREIHWDDELAARAQKWADNCQFRHDPQRTINRFTMGQNLAIIWSTVPLEADDGDFPSRIQNWFNEVQKYSFGDAWSPKTGHYSQLVWGETSLVGCGYSEYKDSSKYNKLYVCNYGPGGNVIGFNPYEVGQPSCGSYGMRPSARYQGLCAAPSLNSIATNTIETYEYSHSNSINTNTNTNTQHTNTNTNTKNKNTNTDTNTFASTKHATYNPSSSSSQQAISSSSSSSSSASASASGYTNTHRSSSSYSYSAASQTNRRTSTVSATSKETGQYNHNAYKYKNKLEAYKPSKTEYQTAIRKHTILRTYINTSSSSKLQTQTHTRYNSVPKLAEVAEVTVSPVKRGWSLLSWRG